MSTTRDTWSHGEVGVVANIKCKTPIRFLRKVYYDILEHCISDSNDMARASLARVGADEIKQLQKDLAAYKEAEKKLITTLVSITKESDKF